MTLFNYPITIFSSILVIFNNLQVEYQLRYNSIQLQQTLEESKLDHMFSFSKFSGGEKRMLSLH